MSGHVDFVGAGPGDPDWITVDGRRRIAAADVLIVDALVHPAILADARWDARVHDVGKRAGRPNPTQDEICRLIVAEALNGSRVVRLKGGDPGTFGRLAEETAALDAVGVGWEIVPGVNAASAAAARSGIPLTDRDSAPSLTLLTGHRRQGGPTVEIDWSAAGRAGTLVVYMGILQVEENVARLRAAGVSADAPVAVVRWASAPGEAVLRSTLAELPSALADARIRPPALWIVGEVAARAACRAPLRRGVVALFRPADEDGDGCLAWADGLRRAGWAVMAWPLQAIVPLPPAKGDSPTPGDWLVWTSPNAVRHTWRQMAALGVDLRAWVGCRLAAVGRATAAALAARGLVADMVAEGGDGADGLVDRLASITPGRILWFGAADGRREPIEHLRAIGWRVDLRPTHEKTVRPLSWTPLRMALEGDWLDAAVWTAASQVRAAAVALPDADWPRLRHVAIGRQTAEAIEAVGWTPQTAASPDLDAVVTALAGDS